jgi:hypothetical protein
MTEETSQPAEPVPAEPAPSTGDPGVDAALASLENLGEVPDTEHVEAFEQVHAQLHEILDEVGEQDKPARDQGPGRR